MVSNCAVCGRISKHTLGDDDYCGYHIRKAKGKVRLDFGV